jgi:hypothetical protein
LSAGRDPSPDRSREARALGSAWTCSIETKSPTPCRRSGLPRSFIAPDCRTWPSRGQPRRRLSLRTCWALTGSSKRSNASAPGCRVLVTSSAQVYAPSAEPITEDQTIAPSSPYALSKLAQEQLALRAATGTIDVIVSRPFNHTGPRQKPEFLAPTVARQIAMIERGRLEPVLKVGNLFPAATSWTSGTRRAHTRRS